MAAQLNCSWTLGSLQPGQHSSNVLDHACSAALTLHVGWCLQDKVKTLTIDEVLASEPELGKRLHAEISEGKFIP